MDWIGLGQKLIGLDWVGLRKLDPCPTLGESGRIKYNLLATSYSTHISLRLSS